MDNKSIFTIIRVCCDLNSLRVSDFEQPPETYLRNTDGWQMAAVCVHIHRKL